MKLVAMALSAVEIKFQWFCSFREGSKYWKENGVKQTKYQLLFSHLFCNISIYPHNKFIYVCDLMQSSYEKGREHIEAPWAIIILALWSLFFFLFLFFSFSLALISCCNTMLLIILYVSITVLEHLLECFRS